jgi:hypothetical protein
MFLRILEVTANHNTETLQSESKKGVIAQAWNRYHLILENDVLRLTSTFAASHLLQLSSLSSRTLRMYSSGESLSPEY